MSTRALTAVARRARSSRRCRCCCSRIQPNPLSAATAATTASTITIRRLDTDDHDLGGLDESRRRLTFLQPHLPGGVRGDDGSDVLAADGESHLREQTVKAKINDAASKLVASRDAAEVAARGSSGGSRPEER